MYCIYCAIGELCWNSRNRLRLLAVLLLSSLLWWSGVTSAAPMTAEHAKKLAQAWVAANPKPMGAQLGGEIESVETFTDANSQPIYHVVYLRPAGFVIVPADDEIEPVICFAQAGSFDPSPDNPLGALVSRDLPGRVNAARAMQKMVRSGKAIKSFTRQEMDIRDSGKKAFDKWSKLLNAADSCSVLATSLGGISDVRVSPLLQSEWSQSTECGNLCYNYYTPNNYVCGCVATAMAQYMRFWQYPTTGVGTQGFPITVGGSGQTAHLRGGNGSGGPYSWTDMPLVPDCSTTLTQRQAIGALTYDAGVAVNMGYESSASGAYIGDADAAMTNTFHYSNSIYGYNSNNNIIAAALNAMINPNLDWGNPVILGISSSSAGHAVVADGYGYNSSTLYHHLNFGWAGTSDAWYNLPNIDSSPSFNIVDSAIYNIYMSGSGEIISGRVTMTGSGSPISGATVTATRSGGGTYSAVTNSNGIYAIAKIPSSSSYTVSVAKTGYYFTSRSASTGLSQDNQPTSGNCWAIDFLGSTARTLTVNSTIGGIVTQPGMGTFTYPSGNVVNLVASADTGYHFVNWTGTAVDAGRIAGSTSATTTVLMDADYTVIASFAQDEYTLTINTVGSGSVTRSPDQATYHYGDSVQLTANTAAGWLFSGWSGNVSGASNPATIIMNSNKSVTATFGIQTFSVTGTAGANGLISPPGTFSKDYGSSQLFTAAPTTGYTVDKWTLDGADIQTGGTTYTLSNIIATHTVSVSFKMFTYTVTASAGANGSINPTGAMTKDYGSSQLFTATANAGYTVDKWQVDGADAQTGGTTYTLSNITATHTVAVSFKMLTYTITASAGANGSISPSGTFSKDYGSSQLFTATPTTGYVVDKWTLDGADIQTGSTAYTLSNITATHTVTVSFKIITYTVTGTAGANGSISPSGTFSKDYGSSQLFTVTPTAGYAVDKWTVDGVDIQTGGTTYTLSGITATHTVQASFVQNVYTLTINKVGSGTVTADKAAPYHYGDVVQLTANSAAGWSFGTWDGGLGTTSPVTITIEGDRTVTATFLFNYALTVDSSGALSVSIASSTGHNGITPYDKTVLAGTSVNLQAPQYIGSGASRLNFTGWSGSVTDSNQSITFFMNEPKAVTANYALKFGSFDTQTNVKRTLKDCNSNDVTFSLSGGGYGEIDPCDCHFGRIKLHDTTDKSVLTIKTKSKIETSVGDINVNGPLKGISATNIELHGSITIGLSSNPKAAVTIIFDQANDLAINSQMPIKSISATEWLGGSIDAPSIGSITTRGDKKRDIAGDLDVNVTLLNGSINSAKVAGTLSGDWTCNAIKGISATDIVEANLILSQQPDSKVKVLALGSLIVKGWIDSSQILSQGNIGTVTAGAMINSVCFADVNSAYLVDVNADDVLDLPVVDSNTFSKKATIKSITIKGIKTEPLPYYINSNIAAAQILIAYLNYPENDNNGIPFGVSAGFIKALKVKDAQGTKSYKNLDTPKDNQDFGDTKIRLY